MHVGLGVPTQQRQNEHTKNVRGGSAAVFLVAGLPVVVTFMWGKGKCLSSLREQIVIIWDSTAYLGRLLWVPDYRIRHDRRYCLSGLPFQHRERRYASSQNRTLSAGLVLLALSVAPPDISSTLRDVLLLRRLVAAISNSWKANRSYRVASLSILCQP